MGLTDKRVFCSKSKNANFEKLNVFEKYSSIKDNPVLKNSKEKSRLLETVPSNKGHNTLPADPSKIFIKLKHLKKKKLYKKAYKNR